MAYTSEYRVSVLCDHIEPIHISCVLVGYCEVFWCSGCCRKGQNTCTYVLINIAGSVCGCNILYMIMGINYLEHLMSNMHNTINYNIIMNLFYDFLL